MSSFIGENNFFIGVVEDRMDPKKLGRVKVRVFGLHTYDKSLLPTADLPWAYKIQPSTSGAITGIGHAPVGVMEGTWVAVQFIDPDKQMPFVIGTLSGIPQSSNPELEQFTVEIQSQTTNETIEATNASITYVTTNDGVPVLDGSGNPVSTEQVESSGIQTADVNWKQKVTDRLGILESSNNYKAVNRLNFIGKYQFGAAALIDRGYVKPGTTNAQLDNAEVWTGKNSIKSKEDFLNNSQVQESVMAEHIDANYRTLRRIGVPVDEMSDAERAGFIAVSHLLGPGGARSLYNGVNKTDANGTSGKRYYEEGFNSVTGITPLGIPQRTSISTPSQVSQRNSRTIENSDIPAGNDPKSLDIEGQQISLNQLKVKVKKRGFKGNGFQDPSGKYPLDSHLDEPDTNRLARHEKIGETIVFDKEQVRHKEIKKANELGQWDQADVPYNAKYPFNNVWQSESGHLLEFDDTPGNERIHLYHPAGTFTEIDHNGSQVRFVIGDDYTIIERNGFVHIMGASHVKVDGAKTLFVEGKTDIQINGQTTVNIHDNAKINIAENLDLTVGGDFNVKVDGNINVYSKKDIGIDTPEPTKALYLNSGKALALAEVNCIQPIQETQIDIDPLKVNTRAEGAAVNYEVNPENAQEYEFFAELAKREGILTEEQLNSEPVVTEKINVTPNSLEGISVEKAKDTRRDFDQDEVISKYYRLRDLTGGQPIVPNAGLTESQIYNNLKALAVNVLDPLREKYPNIKINSGLRFSQNSSQHNRGEAVDISFPDLSRDGLYQRVQDVEKMVPYDQMILEYLTPGGNGWIHISYRENGNRKQPFTMNNHKLVGTMGSFNKV